MRVETQVLPGAATMADRETDFLALVRAERSRAVAVAYHLVGGDRDAAKEVVQEAFLKAHRALPGFRGEAKLSTWFLRILLRECGRYRRWQRVRSRWLHLWGDGREAAMQSGADPGQGPEAAAEGAAIRARIAAALDQLSGPQRAAFALVHLEGLTVEDTAAVLNKAPGTVKSHLHRALKRLRQQLGDLRTSSQEGHDAQTR